MLCQCEPLLYLICASSSHLYLNEHRCGRYGHVVSLHRGTIYITHDLKTDIWNGLMMLCIQWMAFWCGYLHLISKKPLFLSLFYIISNAIDRNSKTFHEKYMFYIPESPIYSLVYWIYFLSNCEESGWQFEVSYRACSLVKNTSHVLVCPCLLYSRREAVQAEAAVCTLCPAQSHGMYHVVRHPHHHPYKVSGVESSHW